MIRRLIGWLRAKLAEHVEVAIGGEESLLELIAERQRAIITAEKRPTFDDAWGCTNCGVLQAQPHEKVCAFCRSEQLVNLVMQLKRGSKRIERRRAELKMLNPS